MIRRVVVLFAVLSASSVGACYAQTTPRRSPDGHLRLALLVGINRYQHSGVFENLRGCVNDVLLFRDLLTTKYDFPPENILVLTDDQATHAGIVAAFQRHLVSNAAGGDKVVFYYAGHGSRAPSPSRPSGFVETIVPFDSRDPGGKVFDIADPELRELLGELRAKTTEITAVLDSCHSGTAIRGNRRRAIAPDTRPQPATRGERSATALQSSRGIVFIAGSRSDQSGPGLALRAGCSDSPLHCRSVAAAV